MQRTTIGVLYPPKIRLYTNPIFAFGHPYSVPACGLGAAVASGVVLVSAGDAGVTEVLMTDPTALAMVNRSRATNVTTAAEIACLPDGFERKGDQDAQVTGPIRDERGSRDAAPSTDARSDLAVAIEQPLPVELTPPSEQPVDSAGMLQDGRGGEPETEGRLGSGDRRITFVGREGSRFSRPTIPISARG